MAPINTRNQKSIEIVYEIRYESVELGIMETGKRHNTYVHKCVSECECVHSMHASFMPSYFHCCVFAYACLVQLHPFLIHIFICYQLLKFLALDLFQCTNIVSFHFVSSYLIVAAPFSRYSLFLCEPVNFCAGNLSKLPCNVHIHQITLVPPNTK